MSYANVGKVWTPDSFKEYLKSLKKPSYPKSITIHHTGAPSLSQRKSGLTIQHIHNIQSFYQSLGWNRGPHLFVDEDQIFGMTPLSTPGIHAVSFNRSSIGIEVLGDYDSEDPLGGRGLQCMKNAAAATRALLQWLDLPTNDKTVLFHRDDPKTSKTCPGKKVTKEWFLTLVKSSDDYSKPVEKIFDVSSDEVSIIDFVVKEKGYNTKDAVKLLKVKAGTTTFDGVWIETARYDASKQLTVARRKELDSDIAKKI
jgi:hypothetical protein